jgi:hypothetical protein
MRQVWPLALMLCADRVQSAPSPSNSTARRRRPRCSDLRRSSAFSCFGVGAEATGPAACGRIVAVAFLLDRARRQYDRRPAGRSAAAPAPLGEPPGCRELLADAAMIIIVSFGSGMLTAKSFAEGARFGFFDIHTSQKADPQLAKERKIGVFGATLGLVFSMLAILAELTQLLSCFLRASQAGIPVI